MELARDREEWQGTANAIYSTREIENGSKTLGSFKRTSKLIEHARRPFGYPLGGGGALELFPV